ncbi:MAG: ubiquinol-cytochrome c reductase cytochrome b subunit [Blastocatellia bacterium]|jgi:ubiquinol-cytochrome c reductase cytochrome b subunit|nr:ubiquinol-cytochrome c reductase cytochrome b subunit [Blastocatellia bacterium]
MVQEKRLARAQAIESQPAPRTTLALMTGMLFDVEPRSRLEAWTRTTAGAVWLLLALQFVTGTLLAFYYVPSTESAHTTVAYIEKVLPAGSWLRALHHYGSQWLTLFLVLHLAQLFWRTAYKRRPVAWTACILLLLLVFANGATGYSLPWDARAFFGTRVAEGLAGGLPLAGSLARRWLLGGVEISALTLMRFYAMHLLVVPALILFTTIARLFIFRERETNDAAPDEAEVETTHAQPRNEWRREQATRQFISAGLVFLALAIYATKFYAPLGPSAEAVSPDYLPRPGLQFLWLFQMLKYLPGRPGSVIALGFPGLFFACLLALPLLDSLHKIKLLDHPGRKLGATLLSLSLIFFALMTALAYIGDRRDPRIRAQLSRQADEEKTFRAQPFEPLRLRSGEADDETSPPPTRAAGNGEIANSSSSNSNAPAVAGPIKTSSAPDAYLKNCANCHGTRGQGFSIFPKLTGVSSKPHRTVEDLIAILDDPTAYGLKPPMKSFADKLTPEEKRQISEWVASLKKGKQ